MASKIGSQFIQQLEHLEPVSQLSKRVVRILGMNPGTLTLQGTNTYLVGTGARRLLIDAGEPNIAEYQTLLRSVLDKDGISIERILLTHWHRDHIGGVKDLYKLLEVKPLIHKYICSNLANENSYVPTGALFHYVSDGDKFEVEGATLRIIHTPGHTDDHISLLLEEDLAIFCGDSILGQRSTTFEDLYAYMKSLELIKSYEPEVLYPGHGAVIENAVAYLSEYIQHRNNREQQIVGALNTAGKPLSTEELLACVYSDIADALLPNAKKNLLLHLGKLEKENRVSSLSDKWELEVLKHKF